MKLKTFEGFEESKKTSWTKEEVKRLCEEFFEEGMWYQQGIGNDPDDDYPYSSTSTVDDLLRKNKLID